MKSSRRCRPWVETQHASANLGQRCLALILVTSLLQLGPVGPWHALAQVAVPDRGAAVVLLADVVALTRELRAAVDGTQFDIESLSMEMLTLEVEAVTDWVRDSIAFEPYVGLLRGARGTLMARAGNALDQSVLLATILRNVGYDVEIGHVVLSSTEAEVLILEALARRLDASKIGDLDAVDGVLDRMAALLGADRPGDPSGTAVDTPVYAMAAEDAAWLDRQLASAGVVLAGADSAQVLIEEARPYHWVRYRLDRAEPWRDAHPAFGRSAAPEGLVPVSVLTDAVPEELQHRFRFEAKIERRVGERLEVVSVMRAWERPTAQLAGEVLTFTNIPDSLLMPANLLDAESMFAGAQVFVPILNDRIAPGALAFDVDGVTLEPSDALNPAAGVFREVGGRFQSGQSALGGLGRSDDDAVGAARALTAQWLEFTFVSPGGAERTYRRTVFDTVGEAARERGAASDAMGELAGVAAALTSSFSFMVTGGALPDAFVLDQKLQRVIASEPLSRALMLDDAAALGAAVPASGWLGHLDLVTAFEMGARAAQAPSYRHEPGLVLSRQVLAAEGTGPQVLDIVANPRRVLVLSDEGSVVSDPRQVLVAGVWDTYVESVMLGDGGLAPRSAAAVMRAARESAGAAEVLYGPDAVVPAGLPDGPRRAVVRDLAAGFAVVLPPTAVERGETTAWWRVDPRTGDTLGFIEDGIGGVIKEYALLFGPIVVGVTAGVVQFFSCLGSPEEPDDPGQAALLGAKYAFCGLCGLFVAANVTVGLWVATGLAFGLGPIPASAVLAEALFAMACNYGGIAQTHGATLTVGAAARPAGMPERSARS